MTIRTFWFNELNPKGLSWRPHFVQFWCGRTWDLLATDDEKRKKRWWEGQHVPNTTKHCGCQRKALWVKSNWDFPCVKIMNWCFTRYAAITVFMLNIWTFLAYFLMAIHFHFLFSVYFFNPIPSWVPVNVLSKVICVWCCSTYSIFFNKTNFERLDVLHCVNIPWAAVQKYKFL